MCTSPWRGKDSRLLICRCLSSLKVILKDENHPSGPRVVVEKELPYYFDVMVKPPPRNKKRTNDEIEHANAGPSSKRRRTNSLSPDTAFTTLEAVPHPEDIEPQTPREQITREIPARDHAQRRTIRPHLSGVPRPPLLRDVHPRRGSTCGGNRIWLAGADFPADLTLFARFGGLIAETVR